MRRGYYGAWAFLRGGPIGGPLSRDDCNTFGAAYNIGTRRSPFLPPSLLPSISLGLRPPPTRPNARALLRVGPRTHTGSRSSRSDPGLDRSTETHTEGRAPDRSLHPPPRYFRTLLRWRIWILVNGIATDLRPGPFGFFTRARLLFSMLYSRKRERERERERDNMVDRLMQWNYLSSLIVNHC